MVECKRKFLVMKEGKAPRTTPGPVRTRNAMTCSKKCARDFAVAKRKKQAQEKSYERRKNV